MLQHSRRCSDGTVPVVAAVAIGRAMCKPSTEGRFFGVGLNGCRKRLGLARVAPSTCTTWVGSGDSQQKTPEPEPGWVVGFGGGQCRVGLAEPDSCFMRFQQV